jgi:type IV pilus assembly protein PilF
VVDAAQVWPRLLGDIMFAISSLTKALPVTLCAVLLGACASKPTTPPPPEPQLAPAQRPSIQQQQVTSRQRAETHTDLAIGYYERAQMAVALEELGIAEKIDPSLPRIYTTYGLVYMFLGETAKAEQAMRQALAIAANDPEVRSTWGVYLCGTGRYAESIAEFGTALRNPLFKSRESALVNAGKCASAAGNSAEAAGYLRQALAINSQNVQAAYSLALIDYRDGRYDQARKLMPAALGDGESSPPALYLGFCIEQRSGDATAAQTYATQLRTRFPDALETAAAQRRQCP